MHQAPAKVRCWTTTDGQSGSQPIASYFLLFLGSLRNWRHCFSRRVFSRFSIKSIATRLVWLELFAPAHEAIAMPHGDRTAHRRKTATGPNAKHFVASAATPMAKNYL
jgi:hypothetical protein